MPRRRIWGAVGGKSSKGDVPPVEVLGLTEILHWIELMMYVYYQEYSFRSRGFFPLFSYLLFL